MQRRSERSVGRQTAAGRTRRGRLHRAGAFPARRRTPWACQDPVHGRGTFFFVFPMLMVGIITVLVLLQRASTAPSERRVLAVAVMGAVGATTAYITVNSLNVLPDKPVLLLYAFFLSQIFGQLLLGGAPFLKQCFLPDRHDLLPDPQRPIGRWNGPARLAPNRTAISLERPPPRSGREDHQKRGLFRRCGPPAPDDDPGGLGSCRPHCPARHPVERQTVG